MDLRQQDAKLKQVALDEFESIQAALTHTHKEIPVSAHEKVSIFSNPISEQGE
jgi:hypothetical protein